MGWRAFSVAVEAGFGYVDGAGEFGLGRLVGV